MKIYGEMGFFKENYCQPLTNSRVNEGLDDVDESKGYDPDRFLEIHQQNI